MSHVEAMDRPTVLNVFYRMESVQQKTFLLATAANFCYYAIFAPG